MKLAHNYSKGPIEWSEYPDVKKTQKTMHQLQAIAGSGRYRPSLWLRRCVQLNLSLYEAC